MFNDSDQKNTINEDIQKECLKVEGNVLQVLSDIQEVTEEFSSTVLVRDDRSSESTIGRLICYRSNGQYCDVCIQ